MGNLTTARPPATFGPRDGDGGEPHRPSRWRTVVGGRRIESRTVDDSPASTSTAVVCRARRNSTPPGDRQHRDANHCTEPRRHRRLADLSGHPLTLSYGSKPWASCNHPWSDGPHLAPGPAGVRPAYLAHRALDARQCAQISGIVVAVCDYFDPDLINRRGNPVTETTPPRGRVLYPPRRLVRHDAAAATLDVCLLGSFHVSSRCDPSHWTAGVSRAIPAVG